VTRAAAEASEDDSPGGLIRGGALALVAEALAQAGDIAAADAITKYIKDGYDRARGLLAVAGALGRAGDAKAAHSTMIAARAAVSWE
jgi:hypothetical protein